MKHKWSSPLPKKCEICDNKLGEFFVDGRTIFGPWAILCEKCYESFGCGLGVGNGQKYKTSNGEGVEGF